MTVDLVILAGTHMAACSGLRRQILEAKPSLEDRGVHVPSMYRAEAASWHNLAWETAGDRRFDPSRGSLSQVVDEAKQSGAEHLLLMSEEFESAALDPAATDRLAELARELGGRARIFLIFRHQLSYLNLVFAIRAINGWHSTWFEDFVRAPTPTEQFDFHDVVARFRAHPDLEATPAALSDVIDGGGLKWILGRLDISNRGIKAGELEVESPPRAMRVIASLMASRLATSRLPDADKARIRQIARSVGEALGGRFPEAGPFWGWTPNLRADLEPRFEQANTEFARVFGVRLKADAPPDGATGLNLREARPGVIHDLIDHLNAATTTLEENDSD